MWQWAAYRCEDAGPLLRDEGSCAVYDADGWPRNQLGRVSRASVQLFSAGELALGLSTAALAPPLRGGFRYGTTSGLSGVPLLALDLLLLVPQQPATLPAPPEPPAWRWYLSPTELRQRLRLRLRQSRPFKTVTGFQKLKALPPAPWPIQEFIDRVLVPAWLGTEHPIRRWAGVAPVPCTAGPDVRTPAIQHPPRSNALPRHAAVSSASFRSSATR